MHNCELKLQTPENTIIFSLQQFVCLIPTVHLNLFF